MILQLTSKHFTAAIDTRGAELISLKNAKGTEYMWQKDPSFWAKCSPLLFPAIGNSRDGKVLIEGQTYAMPKHGLMREREFSVDHQTESSVVLSCREDSESLKAYPYRFLLSLLYTLTDEGLSIEYKVENTNTREMDYCIGAHPAFYLPGHFEEYCLEFNRDEPVPCPVYDLKALEIDVHNREDFLKGSRILDLNYSLFDNDAIIFDTVHSNSVELYSKETDYGLQVDFSGFGSVAFWTPTGLNAPFLCIEPWNGMAIRSDEDDDFSKRFGVKHLEAGGEHHYSIRILPLEQDTLEGEEI